MLQQAYCNHPRIVLQAVYDASPVVRAEVAVGIARLADSHSVLFQVCTLMLAGVLMDLTPDVRSPYVEFSLGRCIHD